VEDFGFGPRRASEFKHRGFWAVFRERHPEELARRVRNGPWFWQRWVPDAGVVVSMYVAPQSSRVGVFFGRNEKLGAVDARWKPYQLEIEAALGGLSDDQRWAPGALGSVWHVNIFAEDNWPAMSDWMVTEATRFERAAVEVLSR
jgi:hypothetical protein